MLTNTKFPVTHRIYQANLKKKISLFQKQICEKIYATASKIIAKRHDHK